MEESKTPESKDTVVRDLHARIKALEDDASTSRKIDGFVRGQAAKLDALTAKIRDMEEAVCGFFFYRL